MFFFLLFLIGKNRHGIGKKGGYFRFGMGPEIRPIEKGRKCPAYECLIILNFCCLILVIYHIAFPIQSNCLGSPRRNDNGEMTDWLINGIHICHSEISNVLVF